MIRLVALLGLACALLPGAAGADEELLHLLRAGGQVLFIRHATTTPGAGDPPQFRLEDCRTQRNLSDDGRAEAKRLGAYLRSAKVPVERVASSPWCRCLDTARLAFGRVDERWDALSNLYGRSQNSETQVAAQVAELRARISRWRGKGNLVLVSHGSVASPLAGVHPAQGEIIVLTPATEGFRVAGRASPPRGGG